jgi:cardiolipin synthase
LAMPLFWGCSVPEDEPTLDDSIPPEPLFILLDAYQGNEQYFLRYRRGDHIYYAAGDLKNRPATSIPSTPDRYEVPVVAPLREEEGSDWQQLTANLRPVPILQVADWADLRHQLFAEFIPRNKNQGVAISFDRVDYFFFYDGAGNFRARRLIDKPPAYTVSGRINLRENFERWQPILLRFLSTAGINSDDVIFSTGDLDKGSIPFLYINARSKLIVLVQYDELTETVVGGVPGGHMLKSIWHFVESNTYTVLVRPFSSLKSLLAVVTDTALETGRSLVNDMHFDGPIPPISQGPPMELAAWERELDRQLDRPASRGKLDFLIDGEGFFPRFVDAVTSARSSVDIRAYIFDNDDVALEIGELLKRRSREGIEVRVLFDGLGTLSAAGEQSSSLPEHHREPASISSYLQHDSRVEVRASKNPWLTGDHAKTMVVDKRVAFLGGMNIGREYRYDWHDLMMEITGPVVDEINDEFGKVWGHAGLLGDFSYLFNWHSSSLNRDAPGYPVRLLYTKPGRYEIFNLQRAAIRRAQRYIYIENAYFTDDSLLRELVYARRRGVDVRVIIPLETDRGYLTRNMVLAANILWKNGVRVFIYPGFSHAKAAVFDGWASVGSANLDRLSLRINKEINIATSEPEAVDALIASLFEPDFAKAAELQQAIPERWTDYIIEMFGDYVF